MSSSAGSVRSGETLVARTAVGQRVTVDPDPKCGICGPCRAGRPASCENVRALGIFRDGALAATVKAPADAVLRAVRRPAGPDRGADRAARLRREWREQGEPRPGESAVIFGAGAIGCLFLAMFKAAGARPVIVVEPQDARAAVATAVGADAVVRPDELDVRRRALCRTAPTSSSMRSGASSARPWSTLRSVVASCCSARTRWPDRRSTSTRSRNGR